jgi:NADPH2:quinone reductase
VREVARVLVVGTASREESAAFVRSMGADHTADHHSLVESVRAVVPDNIEAYAELLTPRGQIVAIDEPPEAGLCCR